MELARQGHSWDGTRFPNVRLLQFVQFLFGVFGGLPQPLLIALPDYLRSRCCSDFLLVQPRDSCPVAATFN